MYKLFGAGVIIILLIVLVIFFANGTIPNKWKEWRNRLHTQTTQNNKPILLAPNLDNNDQPVPVASTIPSPGSTVTQATATPPASYSAPTATPTTAPATLPATGPDVTLLMVGVATAGLITARFAAKRRLSKAALSVEIR